MRVQEILLRYSENSFGGDCPPALFQLLQRKNLQRRVGLETIGGKTKLAQRGLHHSGTHGFGDSTGLEGPGLPNRIRENVNRTVRNQRQEIALVILHLQELAQFGAVRLIQRNRGGNENPVAVKPDFQQPIKRREFIEVERSLRQPRENPVRKVRIVRKRLRSCSGR